LCPDIIFETLRNPIVTLPCEKDADRACLLHRSILIPCHLRRYNAHGVKESSTAVTLSTNSGRTPALCGVRFAWADGLPNSKP
jgi:hypothetical protein